MSIYRESFAASVAKRMIPLQIRVLRKQRGPEWSQARLAKESKLTQGVVSRAEDPDYGNPTLNTLVRIAAGFDCAFLGRFVPFSEVGKWYAKLCDDVFPIDRGTMSIRMNQRKHMNVAQLPIESITPELISGILYGRRSKGPRN
jgi:transcriptional regulator with XRE-family HTH domain